MCHHWFCASLGFRVLKPHDQYFVAVFESGSQTNSVNVFRKFYIFIFVKSRKPLYLQFIRGPRNFDKVIIYYFVYIWSDIGGAIFSTTYSETQLKIYGPLCHFVLPDISSTKVAISEISTIFRFFSFFPKFLQELSELLYSSFASYPIILKHFMY